VRLAIVRIAINAYFLGQPGTGSGQYLANLLKAIPAVTVDHEFLLVAPGDPPGFEVSGLQVEFWRVHSQQEQSRLGKVWFEQVVFPRACRRWCADVAHVPYWGSPLKPSVPTVVTIHDLIPLLLPVYRGSSLVQLYTRLVAASARRAALVLTDSRASKRDIEEHLGLATNRVHLIYLAASKCFCAEPAQGDETIRKHYSLPDRYVLYLAGHDVRKNVAALVEAFATVTQSDDDVALVIGGRLPERDDPLLFDPRPLVQALDLEDVVHFIGWVDEPHKPALLRGAACAVFPSRYEGFGLPVLEALACGVPTVTSSASSLPELLGNAGFAIDPDDVRGLAGAILACLVDEGLVAELRRRGPHQAARFSWSETARQTLAAYEQAMSPQGAN
jgi:glycosyltransferase involved in cell wall biosynthesis